MKEAAWPSSQRVGVVILRSRFESRADNYLDLFHCVLEFKSSATLVNSQLFSLRPVWILNKVVFNLSSLFTINSAKDKKNIYFIMIKYGVLKNLRNMPGEENTTIAPVGFWPRDQNPRTHPRRPGCIHTRTKNIC